MQLPVELIDSAIEELQLFGNLRLSREQMTELLNGSPVVGSFAKYGEFNTKVRGQLADLITQKLLQRNWPECGEGVNMIRFYIAFEKAAKVYGYKVGGVVL
ncbi:hypothetical protein ACA544_02425 [Vibrio cholerae]|uniref:hypothetical protein n=1 Tax=Vibrio cholerae TaxID=666 RepID=UPI003A101344